MEKLFKIIDIMIKGESDRITNRRKAKVVAKLLIELSLNLNDSDLDKMKEDIRNKFDL